jgi:hypothetical protein
MSILCSNSLGSSSSPVSVSARSAPQSGQSRGNHCRSSSLKVQLVIRQPQSPQCQVPAANPASSNLILFRIPRMLLCCCMTNSHHGVIHHYEVSRLSSSLHRTSCLSSPDMLYWRQDSGQDGQPGATCCAGKALARRPTFYYIAAQSSVFLLPHPEGLCQPPLYTKLPRDLPASSGVLMSNFTTAQPLAQARNGR